VDCMDRIL